LQTLKEFIFCNFEKKSPKKTLRKKNDLDQWINFFGNGLIIKIGFVIGV